MKTRVMIFVLFAAFGALLMLSQQSVAASHPITERNESLRQGETRPTLDPSLFSEPKVQKAYQAAKDIPWVLDSIGCFCFCEESPTFKHISLLSCFVTDHGSQ